MSVCRCPRSVRRIRLTMAATAPMARARTGVWRAGIDRAQLLREDPVERGRHQVAADEDVVKDRAGQVPDGERHRHEPAKRRVGHRDRRKEVVVGRVWQRPVRGIVEREVAGGVVEVVSGRDGQAGEHEQDEGEHRAQRDVDREEAVSGRPLDLTAEASLSRDVQERRRKPGKERERRAEAERMASRCTRPSSPARSPGDTSPAGGCTAGRSR